MGEDEFFQDVRGALCQMYPGAYFSSWTSAEEHGLTHLCATDYILFSPNIAQDEVVLIYNQRVHLKKIPYTDTKHILEIPSPNGGYKMADVYQTIIDCIYDTKLSGGTEVTEEIINNYLQSADSNPEILYACARQTKIPSVISSLIKYKLLPQSSSTHN